MAKRENNTIEVPFSRRASTNEGRDESKESSSEIDRLTRSAREIREMLDPHKLQPHELEAKRIIYPEMEDSGIVNKFRNLRTRLLEIEPEKNFITLVTGVVPQAGASYVALNLAAAFAFDNTKTALLIDCNLRNSQLADQLGIDVPHGLMEYLQDPSIDIEDIIYATGVPRMRVIPAGSYLELSSEFFTTIRMKKLLLSLLNRFPERYIFLDVPSIGSEYGAADTRILADFADWAIVVVPYGRVTQSKVKASIEALGKDKVVGLVLNN